MMKPCSRREGGFTMIEMMFVGQGPEAMKAAPATDVQEGKLYLAKYAEDGSLYRA